MKDATFPIPEGWDLGDPDPDTPPAFLGQVVRLHVRIRLSQGFFHLLIQLRVEELTTNVLEAPR